MSSILAKINGVLQLFVYIAVLGVCASIVTSLFGGRWNRKPKAPDMVQVDKDTQEEQLMRLGGMTQIRGTEFLLIPLNAELKGRESFKSYSSSGSTKNFLVFNSKTKDSFWIWKTNIGSAIQRNEIFNQTVETSKQKTRGLIFEATAKDSNLDGKIDQDDKKTLEYFELASKRSAVVVENADRIVGIKQSEDNEVVVLFSRESKSYFKSLNTTTMALSAEMEITQPL